MERKRTPTKQAVAVAETLADNWRRLKASRGNPGLRGIAKRIGVGEATLSRIQDGAPGTQLDTIVAIANEFDIQPWQLMVPNLDPAAPPKLRSQQFSPLVEQIAHQLENNRAQQLAAAALLGVGGISDKDVELRMPITRKFNHSRG